MKEGLKVNQKYKRTRDGLKASYQIRQAPFFSVGLQNFTVKKALFSICFCDKSLNQKSETLIIFFAFVYKCYWTPDYLWLLIIHREMDIEQKQAEHIDFFVKQASALKGSALTTVIVEATSHPSLFAFSEILSVPSVLEVSIHSYYYFYTCSDFVWSFFFFFYDNWVSRCCVNLFFCNFLCFFLYWVSRYLPWTLCRGYVLMLLIGQYLEYDIILGICLLSLSKTASLPSQR